MENGSRLLLLAGRDLDMHLILIEPISATREDFHMATITVTTAADSGAGSLRSAIASAQSGDTIAFASTLANQTITLTSGQIEISAGKELVIDGSAAANLAISGNNSSRIFLVKSTSATPTNLTIKNLSFVNGYTSDRGGAISTEHQAVLTIENVDFFGNVADNGGGAIYSAFEGTLSVTGSRFEGNQATAGNDERGAGAIAFHGPRDFTIRDSDFINNKGINGGAINSLNGKLTIENSRFINNDTTAATYDTGNANPFLRGFGGAIYTDRASASNEPSGLIRIVNSIFDGNQGRGEGGAAYLYTGAQDRVEIVSSVFTDNEIMALPNGGNNGNGGAMVVMSNDLNQGLQIHNTTFANNTASGQGGGVWMMKAPATITNSTFSSNRVNGVESSRVGGGMTLYGPATIINSTFANNYAGWVGGAITASNDYNVSVQNTLFYNNTADNGTNDWGIQQHTSRELVDNGGNIQWPPKGTNNGNDYNATASITLIDPLLGPLQDNGGGIPTHALLPDSPAINAGVITGAPATDQRNAPRDTAPDIGAFEFGAEVPTDGGMPTRPLPTDLGNGVGSGGDVTGEPGNDVLSGSSDNDSINGGLGNDRLSGDTGNDTLIGGDGNDVLKGGAGDDTLMGQGGNDKLLGGAGNDILVGGVGKDTLIGGTGKDIFVYESMKDKRDIIRDFDASQDMIDLSQIFEAEEFGHSRPLRAYGALQQYRSHAVVLIDANGDPSPDRFQALTVLANTEISELRFKNFIG
jgi:predicted outer membrane repeat protein